MSIYVYIYIHVCVFIYVYVYIYRCVHDCSCRIMHYADYAV